MDGSGGDADVDAPGGTPGADAILGKRGRGFSEGGEATGCRWGCFSGEGRGDWWGRDGVGGVFS